MYVDVYVCIYYVLSCLRPFVFMLRVRLFVDTGALRRLPEATHQTREARARQRGTRRAIVKILLVTGFYRDYIYIYTYIYIYRGSLLLRRGFYGDFMGNLLQDTI